MPSRQRPSLSFYGPRPVSSPTNSFESINDDIYESLRVYTSRPRTDSAASSLGSTSSLEDSQPQSADCRRQCIRPLPVPPSSPQPISSSSSSIPPQHWRRKSRWLPVVPLPKSSFPEIAPTECSSPSMIFSPTLVERPVCEEEDAIDWDLIDEIMVTHH